MQKSDVRQSASGGADGAEEYFGPHFLARLHARLHSNPVTGIITKVVVTILGVLVMLAGVVMMVTPGPGIVALVLGLAILSTEWRWADRWLDAARESAKKAAEKARDMDPAVRRRRLLLAGAAVVLVGAACALALALWGWPPVAEDGWDWIQARVPGVPELPGMDA